MVDLSQYRATFADGWTDDDLDSVLPRLSADLGLRVVCQWDYLDEWGAGGDSDLAIEIDGVARELPAGLWDLLVEGEGSGQIDPTPGKVHANVDLARCVDHAAARGGHQYHLDIRNA
jgi:hypothetical protein